MVGETTAAGEVIEEAVEAVAKAEAAEGAEVLESHCRNWYERNYEFKAVCPGEREIR